MKNPPKFNYCGLTIFTNPSRFDLGVGELISGGQTRDYINSCLHPYALEQCELVSKESFDGNFRPGTKCVLVLGEESLQFLGLDKKYGGLDSIRGYPLFINTAIPAIASFHHQDALDRGDFESSEDSDSEGATESDSEVKNKTRTKRKNYKWWLFTDIKKICHLIKSNGSVPSEENWNVELAPMPELIIKFLKETENEKVILDIETTRNFDLTCIGVGRLATREVIVIPWRRYNSELEYSHPECREILRWLLICLARNKIILHNACFDLLILALKYRILLPRDVFDTMIAWHRLRPEMEKSLSHLISYYTWFSYHKDEGILEPKNRQQDEQLWKYNSKDIITTGTVYEKILQEAPKYKAEESIALGNRKVPVFLTFSLHGTRMDLRKREDRIRDFKTKQEAIDKCLAIICRQTLNPRSPKQVSTYLYKQLGLDCPSTKSPTGEGTLRKVLLKNNIPSVNLIIASRGARKTSSSLDFLPYNNDRMTCSWVLAGPDTYRLSSRAMLKRKGKVRSGYGRNFQNFNKDDREIIIADEGKCLIQVDQAGAEALIVAYLCKPGKFRLLFELGIKCHTFVALHLFKEQLATKCPALRTGIFELAKLPIDKLKEHSAWDEVGGLLKDSDNWPARERYYFIAKMVVHSSNYDIRWPTFQNHVLEKSEGQIVLSASEAKSFIQFYRFLFPEIPHYHIDIQAELKQNGRVLRNLFGHPRHFNEPWGDSLFKQAYAFKPQSTVGQITNYAIVELQEANEWGSGFDILQNGHDSILAQCRIGTEFFWAQKIKNKLERNLVSPRGDKFKMRAEVSIGMNWKPCSKKKNPDGSVTIVNPTGMKEVKM